MTLEAPGASTLPAPNSSFRTLEVLTTRDREWSYPPSDGRPWLVGEDRFHQGGKSPSPMRESPHEVSLGSGSSSPDGAMSRV